MMTHRSVALAALLILATGCTGQSTGESASAAGTESGSAAASQSPSQTALASAPPGATLMRDGTLRAGVTYATPRFAKPFTITVPSNTPDRFWFATSTALTRTVAIGDPAAEGVGIAFYLPTGGFSSDGSPASLPDDFAAWLEDNPQLKVSSPRSVSVGGLAGTQIDVAAIPRQIPAAPGLCPAHLSCVLVASTTPEAPLQPLLIYPDAPQQIIVVDLDVGQLLIDIQPDVVVRRPAQRLLASLQFLR